MDCFANIIDWILRLAGVFSLISAFIAIIIKRLDYDVSIYIDRIKESDIKSYKNALMYTDENINGEYLLFMPQESTNIKNVKYREYMFTEKKVKIMKVIKYFKNINCTNGLIINTYYPCGTPSRILEWEADYGVKGRYIIAENGKDGNVKQGNYLYKYSLLEKFRKIIGWK
jgi:hypothetical protein